MCGIVGFVGEHKPDVLAAMTRALAHRGPDGEGAHIDAGSGLHLGQRRLAILDIAGGVQPMWDADRRCVIVFNGQIYNHAELRRELEAAGRRFLTDHSDTEVILQAYLAWGIEGMHRRFNGMWAFALYDTAKKLLLLSRDRFGEKPLYYTDQSNVFAFASETTAFRQHPALTLSPGALPVQRYFAFGFVPGAASIYDRVRKLPAGAWMTLDLATGARALRRYWSFELAPDEGARAADVGGYVEELRARLKRAVAMRLAADVPVGVLLSGGIDSSSVVHFAAESTNQPVKTFSIGFDEPSFDESPYAARVATHYKTEHVVDHLTLANAAGIVPEMLSRLDEPIADSSLVACYLLFRHVRRHLPVVLSGDGGDELFAGYETFKGLRWAKLYDALVPHRLRSALSFVAGLLPVSHRYMSLDFKVKRMLSGLREEPGLWNPAWIGPLAPRDLAEALAAPARMEEVYDDAIAAWNATGPKGDLIDRTLQFYTRLYLTDDVLVKSDRTAMMHSVEARAPFLDNDVVDLARRIPSRLKLHNGTTKFILKAAMTGLLPDWVLARRKQGFGVPVGQWLAKGGLQLEPPADSGYSIARPVLERMLAEHKRFAADHRFALWAQLVLQSAARHA
ncbi:MAG: asparagine synthase (glutamine-hydrolyzing) [Gammaproteobacteria bacterium PRO8]|nr:asparagine synthase (glutamine-hydrolyzing) [Gammaproteobacteria bacterium PRO8]